MVVVGDPEELEAAASAEAMAAAVAREGPAHFMEEVVTGELEVTAHMAAAAAAAAGVVPVATEHSAAAAAMGALASLAARAARAEAVALHMVVALSAAVAAAVAPVLMVGKVVLAELEALPRIDVIGNASSGR